MFSFFLFSFIFIIYFDKVSVIYNQYFFILVHNRLLTNLLTNMQFSFNKPAMKFVVTVFILLHTIAA